MDGRKQQMEQYLLRNAMSYLHHKQLLNLVSVGVMTNAPVNVPARKTTYHVQHFANVMTVIAQRITLLLVKMRVITSRQPMKVNSSCLSVYYVVLYTVGYVHLEAIRYDFILFQFKVCSLGILLAIK
jgi:hypothetical protein